MSKRLSVAVLSAALLMSGALVGVSFAGGGGITEPDAIELEFDVFSEPAVFRFYRLREFDGRSSSQILLGRWPIFDSDGNDVGSMNQVCHGPSVGPEGRVTEVCTFVHKLRSGPYTEAGTVVTTGYALFGEGTRRWAVTGGTGAYMNVRGYAELDPQGQGTYTLYLIP